MVEKRKETYVRKKKMDLKEKISSIVNLTSTAFKNTSEDPQTHTQNPYIVFSIGCLVGNILGDWSLPVAVGTAVGTVFYHEYVAQKKCQL